MLGSGEYSEFPLNHNDSGEIITLAVEQVFQRTRVRVEYASTLQ